MTRAARLFVNIMMREKSFGVWWWNFGVRRRLCKKYDEKEKGEEKSSSSFMYRKTEH